MKTGTGGVGRVVAKIMAALLGLAAMAPAGCARDRGTRLTGRGADSSTLGHDSRALPRGVMIGPPGLGTDLSRRDRVVPGANAARIGPDASPAFYDSGDR